MRVKVSSASFTVFVSVRTVNAIIFAPEKMVMNVARGVLFSLCVRHVLGDVETHDVRVAFRQEEALERSPQELYEVFATLGVVVRVKFEKAPHRVPYDHVRCDGRHVVVDARGEALAQVFLDVGMEIHRFRWMKRRGIYV